MSKVAFLTPTQQMLAVNQINEKLEAINEEELSAYDPRAERITFFNQAGKRCRKSEGNILRAMGFNPKKKRDDGQDASIVRDNIYDEETERTIPVMEASNYGHWTTDLEGRTWAPCNRYNSLKEIISKNKTNFKLTKKLPIAGPPYFWNQCLL